MIEFKLQMAFATKSTNAVTLPICLRVWRTDPTDDSWRDVLLRPNARRDYRRFSKAEGKKTQL
jgi:hypothetical protein